MRSSLSGIASIAGVMPLRPGPIRIQYVSLRAGRGRLDRVAPRRRRVRHVLDDPLEHLPVAHRHRARRLPRADRLVPAPADEPGALASFVARPIGADQLGAEAHRQGDVRHECPHRVGRSGDVDRGCVEGPSAYRSGESSVRSTPGGTGSG